MPPIISLCGPRLLALRLASQATTEGEVARADGPGSGHLAGTRRRGGGMGNERAYLDFVLGGACGGRRCNRSIWEMKVSQSLGDDAYLSMPKHNTHYRARIGCLGRSTGSVYTVARCGCHFWGRNRVFGQSRYVTCKTRRRESDATENTRVIARDEMAASVSLPLSAGGGRVDGVAA